MAKTDIGPPDYKTMLPPVITEKLREMALS